MSGFCVSSTSITALSHFCGACQRSAGRTLATVMSNASRSPIASAPDGLDDGDVAALPLPEHEDAPLELDGAEAARRRRSPARRPFLRVALLVLALAGSGGGGSTTSPGTCVGVAAGGRRLQRADGRLCRAASRGGAGAACVAGAGVGRRRRRGGTARRAPGGANADTPTRRSRPRTARRPLITGSAPDRDAPASRSAWASLRASPRRRT